MKITKHAYDRINERLGLNDGAAKNLSQNALEFGLRHNELTGPLRRFVDDCFLRYQTGNNIRIYAEKVFIFNNETLITVFALDNHLKKIANKLLKRSNV